MFLYDSAHGQGAVESLPKFKAAIHSECADGKETANMQVDAFALVFVATFIKPGALKSSERLLLQSQGVQASSSAIFKCGCL